MNRVTLGYFELGKRIDIDNFEAVAAVNIGGKGYYVRGRYNASHNNFTPTILGDPEILEDYYSEISKVAEAR